MSDFADLFTWLADIFNLLVEWGPLPSFSSHSRFDAVSPTGIERRKREQRK